jgi:hypothetical protein
MKEKNFKQNLLLNKKTVANLNNNEKKNLKGGFIVYPTSYVGSFCYTCNCAGGGSETCATVCGTCATDCGTCDTCTCLNDNTCFSCEHTCDPACIIP